MNSLCTSTCGCSGLINIQINLSMFKTYILMHFSLGKSKMQMIHFVDLEMLKKLMDSNFDKVINHSDYP